MPGGDGRLERGVLEGWDADTNDIMVNNPMRALHRNKGDEKSRIIQCFVDNVERTHIDVHLVMAQAILNRIVLFETNSRRYSL